MMKKHIFFCNNVLLYTINNLSMVLEILISKFSYSLKIISRITFPEPQPDSASYGFEAKARAALEFTFLQAGGPTFKQNES